MDLLKWIKSLDEFLFELMSWLVFWPATLFRTLLRPVAMMRYADAQLSRPEAEQYDEALSPPVFLILTLVIVHVIAMQLGEPDAIIRNRAGVAAMIDSDTSAVVVRLVLFASFPLIYSVGLLLAQRRKLCRRNLQMPFYAQCYTVGVFAAAQAFAAQLGILRIGPDGLSGILMLVAASWLVAVETIWLRRVHRFRWPGALGLAMAGMVCGTAVVVGAGILLIER